MWVFTQDGFYSAVQHHDDPTVLVVRCRSDVDALVLAEWLVKDRGHWDSRAGKDRAQELLEYRPGSDYRVRIQVSRDEWLDFLDYQVDRLDYPNYKNQVTAIQGNPRARIYHDVWEDMLQVTDLDHPVDEVRQAALEARRQDLEATHDRPFFQHDPLWDGPLPAATERQAALDDHRLDMASEQERYEPTSQADAILYDVPIPFPTDDTDGHGQ